MKGPEPDIKGTISKLQQANISLPPETSADLAEKPQKPEEGLKGLLRKLSFSPQVEKIPIEDEEGEKIGVRETRYQKGEHEGEALKLVTVYGSEGKPTRTTSIVYDQYTGEVKRLAVDRIEPAGKTSITIPIIRIEARRGSYQVKKDFDPIAGLPCKEQIIAPDGRLIQESESRYTLTAQGPKPTYRKKTRYDGEGNILNQSEVNNTYNINGNLIESHIVVTDTNPDSSRQKIEQTRKVTANVEGSPRIITETMKVYGIDEHGKEISIKKEERCTTKYRADGNPVQQTREEILYPEGEEGNLQETGGHVFETEYGYDSSGELKIEKLSKDGELQKMTIYNGEGNRELRQIIDYEKITKELQTKKQDPSTGILTWQTVKTFPLSARLTETSH